MYAIATRHGMTLGELISLLAARHGWEDALRVVEMEGWRRDMTWAQTGLPWVMPSPNMPTVDTAIVYPGQCLLEGTTMSEGRGTTRPFEIFGAPWIDARELVQSLEACEVEGALWRPLLFEPTFQKHARAVCQGAQLHVTNGTRFRSLHASLAVLSVMLRDYEDDFAWRREAYEFVSDRLAIDLLLGEPLVRHALEDGMAVEEILAGLEAARAPFEADRRSHLRY
jgi:uncharacterized protein YbbC (DUF1343 family)